MAGSNQADFTLLFKTIGDATGITAIQKNLDGFTSRLENFRATAERALAVFGLGLGIRELNELANEAEKARNQQAAFALAVERSADGSKELVAELNAMNDELDRSTGVDKEVTQAMEQRLATTRSSGEEIKSLTKGIIEFAAATGRQGQEIEIATLITNRLRTSTDEGVSSLARLGITGKTTSEIIQNFNTIGGQSAEQLSVAKGGLDQYSNAVHDLHLALGQLVLLFKIPFLTTLNEETQESQEKVKAASGAYTEWGANIVRFAATSASVIANFVSLARASWDSLIAKGELAVLSNSSAVSHALEATSHAIQLSIIETITALDTMVTATATAVSELTGGKIQINVGGVSDALGKMAASAHGYFKSFDEDLKGSTKAIDDQMGAAKGKLQSADDEFKKLYDAPEKAGERAVAAYKKYASAIDSLAGLGQKGAGVIAPGVDPNAGAKEGSELLAEAKLQLTSAEHAYQAEIERTNLLEAQGAITSEEANARRHQAGVDYLGVLQQISDALPPIIERLDALGKTEGANELKSQLQEVELLILKIKTLGEQDTFFGGLRKSFQDFFNSIAPTGANIGQRLTQTLGTAIQGISNGITGLIFRTQTWGQAMLQVGQAVVGQLVQMGVELAVYYAKKGILMAIDAAKARTLRAADTADHVASETTKSGASFISAVLTSISSYGAAAAIGLAAVIAAITAFSAGAFAEGGVVPGSPSHTDNRLAWVASGEGILTTSTVQRHGGAGFVDALNSGAFFTRPAYAAGGVVGDVGSSGGGGALGASAPIIKIYSVNSHTEALRMALEDPEGHHVLMDFLRGNAHLLPK